MIASSAQTERDAVVDIDPAGRELDEGIAGTAIAAPRASRSALTRILRSLATLTGLCRFVVNDTNPELSSIHTRPRKGTWDLGQENPHE